MATMDNRIQNVAVVGAGGNCGKYITEALLATSKHTVTAITREGSTSEIPKGIHSIKTVDYANKSTLVEALRGQQVLVITLGGFAPADVQKVLIEAAIEAGIQYILPNEWSPDTANKGLLEDVGPFASKPPVLEKISSEGKGRTQYIAVTTGFWYEWSLAIAPAYGFDFSSKAVTFFDDGKTIIDTSTWPHVGQAVAALLSLPIIADDGGKACLSFYGNKRVYTSSFALSQKDMFESVLRVTDTKADDWNISYVPSTERYAEGVEQMKSGERTGFAKMMYTRVFFQDGSGNFSKSKGTVDGLLKLPKEDLDKFTTLAIERSKQSNWG